jgi:hypothetical protein
MKTLRPAAQGYCLADYPYGKSLNKTVMNEARYAIPASGGDLSIAVPSALLGRSADRLGQVHKRQIGELLQFWALHGHRTHRGLAGFSSGQRAARLLI